MYYPINAESYHVQHLLVVIQYQEPWCLKNSYRLSNMFFFGDKSSLSIHWWCSKISIEMTFFTFVKKIHMSSRLCNFFVTCKNCYFSSHDFFVATCNLYIFFMCFSRWYYICMHYIFLPIYMQWMRTKKHEIIFFEYFL